MLLWADSFDTYGNGDSSNVLAGMWSNIGSSMSVNNATARTGTYSMRWILGSTIQTFRRSINTSNARVGVGYGLYVTSLPPETYHVTARIADASVSVISITLAVDGSLQLRSGGIGGSILATSDPGVITAAAWNHIEYSLLRDPIVGEAEVRVNGQTVIQVTNQNFGSGSMTNVVWERGSGAVSNPAWYLDDVFVWDGSGTYNNDFLGPARIFTVFPGGDTAEADWTKSTGTTGYTLIDEVPPNGDTDYIAAANVGDRSEFSLGTIPSEVEAIKGVFIPVMAKLEAAGIGNLQTALVSGGDVALGTDFPLTTAYTYWGSVFEQNPDTGTPWTKASLSAATVRVEKTL